MLEHSIELDHNSYVLFCNWLENEVKKLKQNPHFIEKTKINIVLINKEVSVILNLSNVSEFILPKIDISSSKEINFKIAIEFLNEQLITKKAGIVYWIVSDNVFNKLYYSKIKDSLSVLKNKIISGSIIIRIQDLNNFTLTDFDNWAISCFIGDTFDTFIDDLYKNIKQNIIAV
jgi:hypothetical protein